MQTTNPEEIASKYGLDYVMGEWHGANPFEAGATEDGFILFHEGNAYDRKLNRSYNRNEVARLSGVSSCLYVPLTEAPARKSLSKIKTKAWVDYRDWQLTEYYYNMGGKPYSRVVRFDPPAGLMKENGKPYKKTFSQQTWSNDGYWQKKAPAVPILYQYDIIACSRIVFVVEGEKAADRLNNALADKDLLANPYVATTAPGGSGKALAWDSLDMEMATRKFIILPDNDVVGLKYAKKVQRKLRELRAHEARIVIIPGLPDTGDVVDYLDAGNTVEDLLKLTGEL